MSDANSVMSRIFKSRYYPWCNFLEATITGYQPSYAWRSIICGREILEKGTRCVVGNGQSIKIWHDKWLLDHTNFKVHGPVQNLPSIAIVSDLIDLDTKKWKRGLIASCFNQFEASQITKIQLHFRLPDDRIIWHWEKDGIYSVKSAYHLLIEENARQVPSSSSLLNSKLGKQYGKPRCPTKSETSYGE